MSGHGIPRVSSVDSDSDLTKQKQQQKIQDYRNLVSQVQEATRTSHSFSALPLTSKLLSQNPEYYTVWNERRRILSQHFDSLASDNATDSAQDEIKQLLKNDLAFIFPLLVKFPKCYWIWNHRLWLLQQASLRLVPVVARKFWTDELDLATKMLARDSRNFHGWGYRRMVVAELESDRLIEKDKQGEPAQSNNMIKSEFDYTTRMINTNLSNFSAWHNRSKLIPRLLDDQKAEYTARKQLLDDELQLILEALYTDPYDQSLWFYHTYLTTTFSASPKMKSFSIIPSLTTDEQVKYLDAEIEKLKELLLEANDCKWIYQRLLELCLDRRKLDGNGSVDTSTILLDWLKQLSKLDPLRAGRWEWMNKRLEEL